MARAKRSSRPLKNAERREASVKSIDENFDLGKGLTAKAYADAIGDLRKRLASYNTALSKLDSLYNQLQEAERTVNDLSEKILLAVAVKYGKDSREYEMAGGVRKSERRRPRRIGGVSPAPA